MLAPKDNSFVVVRITIMFIVTQLAGVGSIAVAVASAVAVSLFTVLAVAVAVIFQRIGP